MEVTTLQENLHKAVSFVGRNISQKTQLPILSNILLETEKGRLKLTTTNLETTISVWIGATIEKAGKITVPARLFAELVGSFTHDKVELSVAESRLDLRCGEAEATLNGIDAQEFPPRPQITAKRDFIVGKKVLIESVPLVIFSASTDEGRPLLTGVRVVKRDGLLEMVATDGYRLSIKKISQIEGLKEGIVLPAKALLEVMKAAKEADVEDVEVFFSQDKNQIVFSLPDVCISTRLIEGDYPTYEKIIPSGFTTKVEIGRVDFLQAVKFASVYAKESANIVKINTTPDALTVSANTPQIGENKSRIIAKVEGEALEIAFNVRFLLDFLTTVPFEEVILESNGPLAPGAFKSPTDESFLHIIMPVRVQT